MNKIFKTNSPCELTTSNMDRSCALDGCPNCDYKGKDEYWAKNINIVAICQAPWVGGIAEKRPLAIVYECKKCFEYFWFHTTESHKKSLERLYEESEGFTK